MKCQKLCSFLLLLQLLKGYNITMCKRLINQFLSVIIQQIMLFFPVSEDDESSLNDSFQNSEWLIWFTYNNAPFPLLLKKI